LLGLAAGTKPSKGTATNPVFGRSFPRFPKYFGNCQPTTIAGSEVSPLFLGIFSLFTLLVPVLLVIAAGGKASL
jgi:hypothetical protein